MEEWMLEELRRRRQSSVEAMVDGLPDWDRYQFHLGCISALDGMYSDLEDRIRKLNKGEF